MTGSTDSYWLDGILGFFLVAAGGTTLLFVISLWVSYLSEFWLVLSAVVLACSALAATAVFALGRIHRRTKSYSILVLSCVAYSGFVAYTNLMAFDAAKDLGSISANELDSFSAEQGGIWVYSLASLGPQRCKDLWLRLNDWHHPFLRYKPPPRFAGKASDVNLGAVGGFSIRYGSEPGKSYPELRICGRDRQWTWDRNRREWAQIYE